jgi:Ca-activated chloride channel family protein
LALAILILLIAFSSLPKRKVVSSLLFILVCFFPMPQYAFSFDFTHINEANKAYKNGDFKTAAKEFSNVTQTAQGSYNFANSLYKQQQYQKALKQYEHVITNNKNLEYKKLHNMGNCFVKLNKLEKAKEFYEKALKIKKDKQTKENLDKVNELLKKKKKNNQKQKSKNNKNKQNDKQNKKSDKRNQNNQNNKNNKNKKDNKNQSNNKNNKSNNEQKNNKNKQDLKKQNKKNIQQQKIDTKIISDTEEKKWMKIINEQKTSVMLHKIQTKQSENDNDIKNPW